MKKRFLTLLAILLTAHLAISQSWHWSPFVAVNYSFGKFNDYKTPQPYKGSLSAPSSFEIYREMQGEPGFSMGAVAQRKSFGKYSLESGLLLKNINYLLEGHDNLPNGLIYVEALGENGEILEVPAVEFNKSMLSYRNSLYYLGVPLSIGAKINKKLGFSIGANACYLLHAKQEELVNFGFFSTTLKDEGKDALRNFMAWGQAAVHVDLLEVVELRFQLERSFSHFYDNKDRYANKPAGHIKNQAYQMGFQCLVKFD